MQLTGLVRGAEVNHIENMKYGEVHFSGALKDARVPPDMDMGKLANWCLNDRVVAVLAILPLSTISCLGGRGEAGLGRKKVRMVGSMVYVVWYGMV